MALDAPELPRGDTPLDPPGPEGDEIRESFELYRADPLKESMRLFRTYGDVVALRRGPFTTIFLFHPDHAKHVLVKKMDSYSRKTAPAKKLRASLGVGVITSDKPEWTRQRKLAAPAFTKKAIDQNVPMFNEVARELVCRWQEAGGKEPFDVHHPGGVALLTLVGRILMSEAFSNEKADRLRHALTEVAQLPSTPSQEAIQFAKASGRGADDFAAQNERFLTATAVLDDELERIIRERRSAIEAGQTIPEDVLSTLLTSVDEVAGAFSDLEVRDQIKNLVIAGHDTTMAALSFSLYQLASHPEVVERVREEVERIVGKGEGDVTAEHLDQLTYTEAVVAETLRLCPSVAHIDRRAEEEDVLSGYRIPKGASVALCPYVVQRREDCWEDALAFVPERFLGKPPAAYFPFALGPRTCLGRALSILEVKLFLAHVVRAFNLAPVDGYELQMEVNWTVHPRGATLPLWVRPR